MFALIPPESKVLVCPRRCTPSLDLPKNANQVKTLQEDLKVAIKFASNDPAREQALVRQHAKPSLDLPKCESSQISPSGSQSSDQFSLQTIPPERRKGRGLAQNAKPRPAFAQMRTEQQLSKRIPRSDQSSLHPIPHESKELPSHTRMWGQAKIPHIREIKQARR